jgi:hypothetical protein
MKPVITATVVVLLAVGWYLGGYFAAGESNGFLVGKFEDRVEDMRPVTARIYPWRWLARIYLPAAFIEESIFGIEVRTYSRQEWIDSNG